MLKALNNANLDELSELRLRTGFPVFGLFNGVKAYLSENGITKNKSVAIKCTSENISHIISKITECSLYAFNDRLKQGYLTTQNGVRVGVAGECVFDNGKILTIKRITSLNIRIPHEIKDCSREIYEKTLQRELFNMLIVSPPAKGKTTILKDLARKLNEKANFSILIIDERGEFGDVLGENIDVIRYSDKIYALNYAIRSMSPQVIITDELQSVEDWKCAERAALGGVKIIASCHGKNLDDVCGKEFFKKGVFERYAVIGANNKAGSIEGLYDGDFNKIQ